VASGNADAHSDSLPVNTVPRSASQRRGRHGPSRIRTDNGLNNIRLSTSTAI